MTAPRFAAVALLLVAGCAAPPSYTPGACPSDGAVSTSIGGTAGLGVSNEGPITDADLSISAVVTPGRIGCVGSAAGS